jgi:hypothetical protein
MAAACNIGGLIPPGDLQHETLSVTAPAELIVSLTECHPDSPLFSMLLPANNFSD